MRRRTIALVGIAIVAAVVLFVFAPIVYSPALVQCGGACANYGGHSYYIPAYESPSCALFGVGSGYSTSELVYGAGSPYQMRCPIGIIFTP